MSRREFSKALGLGLGAAFVSARALARAPSRRLKIGYTGITWGAFPRGAEASATLDAALADIHRLGFHSFETFPEILEDWEAKGELAALLERHRVPLASGYLRVNLTDPEVRKENLAQIIRLAKIVLKYGGTFGVLGPNGIKREAFDFKAQRATLVAVLEDAAKAINDVGLGAGLHPHTGTAIETRDEVYAVLESADTKHMTFAPDVGQLQKGGMDARQVVKDFLPIVRHVHLKDWNGGEHFGGYCPLGQGKVDMAGVLDLLETIDPPLHAMIELDPSKDNPTAPLEAARISKDYLQKLGYEFQA
jgi:inosose dehydratase